MEPEPVARLVAARVRRMRRERGWSAERLAKACEEAGYKALTRSTIAKIESGVRKTVTATEIAGLAKALDITPTQLLAPELLGQPDVALSMWPALRTWFGRQATRLDVSIPPLVGAAAREGAEESDIKDLGFGKKSVFLSHNRADRPFVRRISQELRKRGVPYWLDEAEILPGDSLIEKIAAGITEMDYLLCFISEDSVKSSWVKKEISIALTREIEGRQVRVVPAMIGSVRDEQIPPAIADKCYLDFRSNVPFEKAMHELLMLLDEGYATFVSRLVKMLDEPDESRSALEGVLLAAGFDVEGIGELSWYDEFYKSMGLEIDRVFEMYEHRRDGAVERLARDLRRDIPYPLWDRLANVDTLRQLLRGYGKDV